jgi:hypothetical protein
MHDPVLHSEPIANPLNVTTPPATPTHPNQDAATAVDSSQESQSSQRQPPNMNTINLRTNNNYGNDLQLPKPSSVSRFVSLNINGFRRANNFQDALEIAQALKVTSADLCNFQETKVDWRSACLSQCYDKFRKVFHHARLSTSSSTIQYRTHYQPQGEL